MVLRLAPSPVCKGLGTRGTLGRITLILTAESLVEITETTRTEVRWKDIAGVDEVGEYTFIFITGLSAVTLPRHGCDTDDDYRAARDFALAQVVQRAKPGSPTDGPSLSS
jgi:hypothetical protein